MDGTQEQPESAIGDLAAVLDAHLARLPEMETHQDAGECVLVRCLEKLEYERVTDAMSSHVLPAGSVKLQVSKLISSVPKNRRRTWAAAPPSTLCAES